MKIVDIADEIFRELGNPSTISIPAISFWIRSNVGELNNRINTTFKIRDTNPDIYELSGSFVSAAYEPQAFNEATGALGLSASANNGTASTPSIVAIQPEEASILKKMYIVHYYDQQIRSTVGAASTDPIVEVASDGSRVRKINKNELSKTYIALKKEEYSAFYKSISHDSQDPMLTVHTRVEGVNEYTTLFYIPETAPMDMYRADYQPGVKLYVKRVFITDSEKELLPTYLRFVRGIIDSEDLPLNVSREILQENRVIANIKQSSVKKILGEIKKLAKNEEKYEKFIAQYNRALKEGVYQDFTNKDAILELVRYKSTNNDKMTSLAAYKDRAVSDQKAVFYIVGDNEKVLNNSPLLEAYKKNNIEVLILDDKEIDEIITPAIGAYKEWPLKDISSCEAPAIEQSEDKKKEVEEKFQDITKKIKDILGEAVTDVRVTNRLSESPSCVVKDSNDQMAQMAQMMRSMGQEMPETAPILEINPDHEIVTKLNTSKDDSLVDDIAWLLLDQAKLSEGIDITDAVSFAQRLNRITAKAL